MLQFPPLPTWDSLHPLIIHFPIALLLLCPLFILISAIPPPPKGKPYMTAALLILLWEPAVYFLQERPDTQLLSSPNEVGLSTRCLRPTKILLRRLRLSLPDYLRFFWGCT